MNYKDLIIKKFERLKIPYEIVSGSDWIKCTCINPEHEDTHPSAGVNIDSGIFYCFSCGYKTKFITDEVTNDLDEEEQLWGARYNSLTATTADEEILWQPITLPPCSEAVTSPWRQISAELLSELGVYYCSQGRYKGRYIFPMYKGDMVVGFDARIVDDTARVTNAKWLRPKGMNATSIVYPLDKIKDMGKDYVIVCEGVMDAVSYIQMGVPAIPSFGISPPTMERITQLIALGIENVTLAFDNDEAGREGMLKVLPYYSKWFNIVDHPMVAMVRASGQKDANDFLVDIKTNGLKKQETSWDNEDLSSL